jgi:hypothetical protein
MNLWFNRRMRNIPRWLLCTALVACGITAAGARSLTDCELATLRAWRDGVTDRNFKPPVRTKPAHHLMRVTGLYVEPKLRGRAPCRENRAASMPLRRDPGR